MYNIPIDEKVYRFLNKQKSIDKYFYSNSVGKCIELIDKCYHINNSLTKQQWEKYYLTHKREERIGEIVISIKELYPKINDDDIVAYTYHRILGQTYNGYNQELKIISELQILFPKLDFVKALFDLDKDYFTDIEAYKNDRLIFGGQIKPITYKYMSSPYQLKQKELHKEQKKKYNRKFKVPHLMIYYKDGEILNKQKILNKINTYLFFQI